MSITHAEFDMGTEEALGRLIQIITRVMGVSWSFMQEQVQELREADGIL